jgi:hypothetical protein
MLITYHFIKRIVLIFSLTFFCQAMNAQDADTLVAAPSEEVTIDEGYKDDPPAESKTIYFSDKLLQANGGGPDSMQTRILPDTIVKKLQSDNDFWYVNYPFKKEKEEKEEEKEYTPLTETTLFQTILWLVIIGGFAAFIIMYLSNSNVGLFRKNNKSIAAGEEGYAETDNIFEINYQREIDKAVSAGNYRLAVRLMFLRALKNLSDKNIIQYKQDRTNFDYLLQVHSTKYYPDFFRLTRNYEYSWYGQFDIEPEKFNIIKNDFENFDSNLNIR